MVNALRIEWAAPSDTKFKSIPKRELFGLVRYEEVNGERYIDVTTSQELPHGAIVRMRSGIDLTTREYVVWGSEEPHDRDLLRRTYRCVWSLQAMLSASTSSAMPGTGGTPATARQALTALLQEQGAWAVGTVEPTLRSSASFWRMTAWEGLGELVKTWGGEVDAVYDPSTGARTLSLLDRIGADGAFSFVWGSSEIDSVARRMADGPNVCRIIPIGAASETDSGGYGRKIDITSVNGGVPYIEDAEKAAEYAGLPNPHPTAYVENPEITDPAELKAWGETVLHSVTRPSPEYDVALVEKYVRNDGYVPALGDRGTVVDESLGVELSARVYAITVDELAGSVKAVCSASSIGLGAMAQLVTAGTLGAVADAKGTTCASLLLTTTDSPYTSAITAYDRGTAGQNVFWRPGGNLVIGAGEFADSMRAGNVESCFTGTGEDAWVGADGTLRIVSNANTVANRKTWIFTTGGDVRAPSAIDGSAAPSSQKDAGGLYSSYRADDHQVRSIARQTAGNVIQHLVEAGRYINGAWVWNAIGVNVADDGTRSYTVADRPAFRDAIGASGGTWPISMGGTGQTDANSAARALGLAKTAGDTITMNNVVVNGYLSNGRKTIVLSLPTPFMLYGVSSITAAGTIVVRQNNSYLFGSSSSAAANMNGGGVTTTAALMGGFVNLTIVSTSEQTAAINNDPVAVTLKTLTLTLA